MNEPKDTTVQPYPETLMLFDRADDEAVIAKLEGQVVESYVYSFPQPNGTVYGIGIDGAAACKRELAMTGEVIEEDDVRIESETPDEARFQAKCSRWAVSKEGQRIKLDNHIGLKRQPKYTTRRNGSTEANPHWYEQGGSKATRNAILKLTPKEIQLRIIDRYKGTKHEKKMVMTAEVADSIANEAHASMAESDERKALVYKLQERWRDLGLMQSAVKLILEKKGLPAVLATRNADWSGVDLAVIRDLLAEAGGV